MKYMNTTDSEAYRKVRPSNKSLLEEFLKYLKSIGRGDGTLREYRFNLKMFFIWNLNHNDNKDFIEITKNDFIKFQNVMRHDWKLRTSSMRNTEAAVSSLANYIARSDITEGYVNVFRDIKTKMGQVQSRQIDYSEADIDALLDILTEVGYYREACAVALMAYSGMSNYDALTVPMSCFDKPEVYCKKFYKIQVNDRWFYVIKDMFDPYLDNWKEQRKDLCIRSKWLFPASERPSRCLSSRRFRESFRFMKNEFDAFVYWESISQYAIKEFMKLDISYDLLREMSGIDKKDMITMYVSNRKEKQK